MDPYGRAAAWLAGLFGAFSLVLLIVSGARVWDACTEWGGTVPGNATLSPGQPCSTSPYVTFERATFLGMLAGSHGTAVVAGALAIRGAVRERPALVRVAGVLLLVAAPFRFWLFDLTFLVAATLGLICLYAAWKMPRSPAPSA